MNNPTILTLADLRQHVAGWALPSNHRFDVGDPCGCVLHYILSERFPDLPEWDDVIVGVTDAMVLPKAGLEDHFTVEFTPALVEFMFDLFPDNGESNSVSAGKVERKLSAFTSEKEDKKVA